MMPKLLTVKETAQILRIKEKTLYQWAKEGHIPRLKLNGALRFNEDEIKNWIRSCTSPAPSSYNPLTKPEARMKGGGGK